MRVSPPLLTAGAVAVITASFNSSFFSLTVKSSVRETLAVSAVFFSMLTAVTVISNESAPKSPSITYRPSPSVVV